MSRLLLWLIIVALGAASRPAQAEPERTLNQRAAALKVAQHVSQVAGKPAAVFVREFRGFGETNVGLASAIGEQLAMLGIKVERGAPVEVEGRVLPLPVGFAINCTIVLSDGRERKFSVEVLNRDEGQIATGRTGETSAPPDQPHGTPPKTGPVVDGTILRPAAGSPYGVEFLVERRPNSYDALTPSLSGGNGLVKVRKGDIVAVRVHNATTFEAAVEVLVDGLPRFALADDPHRRGGLDLIGPGGRREIKGYYRNDRGVDAFQVGEYSKSPAAKLLPDASSAGTFTIALRAAWKAGDQPPPNEPPKTKSLGVNQGPPREDPTQLVEREIGGVRAVIKIFYEE